MTGKLTLTGTEGGGATGTTALDITGGNSSATNPAVNITGHLVASTKSFNIPHPIDDNKRLVYGCLEGPEHSVYNRGTMYWYNPYQDINTKEIWPNKETSSRAGNNTIKTLVLASEFSDEAEWNGITTNFYEGSTNQSDKKFLEIWLNSSLVIFQSLIDFLFLISSRG